jgi:hypothetical protein
MSGGLSAVGAEYSDCNASYYTARGLARTAIIALICLSAFCLPFWFYGLLRTGTFHFNLNSFFRYMAIAVALPLVPVASLIFSRYSSRPILGVVLTLVPTVCLYTVFTFPGLLVFLIPAALVGALFLLEGGTPTVFLLTLCSLLIGSVSSELTILYDEAQFEREVSRLSAPREYIRARAWPNQNESLLFDPDSGIRCID